MEAIVPVAVGALAFASAYGLLVGWGGVRRPSGDGMPVAVRVLWAAGAWLDALPAGQRAAAVQVLACVDPWARRVVPGAWLARRPERCVAGFAAVALGACAVAGGVLLWSWMGAVAGAGAWCAVVGWRWRAECSDRADALERELPDAFRSLAVALGSGLSLGQAMSFVAARAEEPIRTEFSRVALSIDCGVPALEALDELIERVDGPGLETVALALKVSQRTGAPLHGLLSRAAQMAQGRLELKRHLDVKTSQARMSARLVAAMPVAMVGALSLISSDFRAGAASVTGAACIAAALALNVLAWSIIRKIMEVRI